MINDFYGHFLDPFRSELSRQELPTLETEVGCSLIACGSFKKHGREILDKVAVKCLVCGSIGAEVLGREEDFALIADELLKNTADGCEYWKKLPIKRDTL